MGKILLKILKSTPLLLKYIYCCIFIYTLTRAQVQPPSIGKIDCNNRKNYLIFFAKTIDNTFQKCYYGYAVDKQPTKNIGRYSMENKIKVSYFKVKFVYEDGTVEYFPREENPCDFKRRATEIMMDMLFYNMPYDNCTAVLYDSEDENIVFAKLIYDCTDGSVKIENNCKE